MNLPFNETNNFTHADLVTLAREWLKPKCSVVVSEINAGSEQPDAIGWKGRETILIECKATRADFLADKKKFFRQNLSNGVGNYRYFLASAGAIRNIEELPEGFGWLEVNQFTGKITMRKKADRQPAKFIRRETAILLSLVRRIGQQEPAGCSIRCYSYETKNRTVLEVEK